MGIYKHLLNSFYGSLAYSFNKIQVLTFTREQFYLFMNESKSIGDIIKIKRCQVLYSIAMFLFDINWHKATNHNKFILNYEVFLIPETFLLDVLLISLSVSPLLLTLDSIYIKFYHM